MAVCFRDDPLSGPKPDRPLKKAGLMENGKWEMAKCSGFFHLPFTICYSGCVFQHPAKAQSPKPGPVGHLHRLALSSGVALAIGAGLIAQGLDPAMLLKPPADSWPTYRGDYSGQHYSRLKQITTANVHQLTLAWVFDTAQNQQIKANPILVNGVLYVTTPDNAWAVDARSGRQIWRYTYPTNKGFHIGHRGAAMYKDLVYLTTPDAHLVALNAKDGKVRWDVEIADARKGFWSTNAPLLIRNHLIVGVSGDFDNLPGILKSFDPETGTVQWTFYSTYPRDTPESQQSGGATGGQMWMTGTYDPELNLMFVGTGNPTPVLNGEARPGDNPWTCSIVALDPDTGKLAWGYQVSPHDTHDWDAAEVPVLVDGNFNGTPRKMLLQASRNGYFFVLDRTNGKSLLTTPFATVNWSKGLDKDGRPMPDPAKEPARDGRLVAPNEGGGTNYRSPGFDPENGLLVVSAVDGYGIYFFKKEHGDYGWAGADYGVSSRGFIRAIDYQTGKIRWSREIGGGSGAGVLTTATGLTFTGDSSTNVMALRTSDGTTLWHSSIGAVGNSPITYELDGRQYLLVGGGPALYAFALPEKPMTVTER
jgi:alcohol dehydrogenase (cytochrome c)